MRQKTSETAMKFFYRPNEAGIRAGIKYKKSSWEREEHIMRFFKNLRDPHMKGIPANQKFKSMSELEDVLEQQEELGLDGDGDAYPARPRESRPDTSTPRFKPKRRAYVGISDTESGGEFDARVRFQEEEEKPKAESMSRRSGSSPDHAPRGNPDRDVSDQGYPERTLTDQEFSEAVFKAIEQGG